MKFKYIITAISFIALLFYSSLYAQNKNLVLVGMDYDDLLAIREDLKAGKKEEIILAYKALIKSADKTLNDKPYKVTDGYLPPTGDAHDFFTIGKLAWRNPDTKDGLPYIRKDGKTNPESQGDNYDMTRYNSTVKRIRTLSLAWFYSQDEKYADKAAEQLRVWFLNPETRMNPNFNCSSALPGVYNGMPIGIIFGAQLVGMIDHVQLLTLSESWTDKDNDELKKWFDEYAVWLLTSDFGSIVARATNNHGLWYSAQLAGSAIYNGRIELAKNIIENAKRQLSDQVAGKDTTYMSGKTPVKCPRGSLPRELYREDAFSYSKYALEALCTLAGCAKAIDVDFWNYQTEDGKGLKLAFEFITPYFTEKKKWEWKTLGKSKNPGVGSLPIIRAAAKAYGTKELKDAEKYLSSIVDKPNRTWLTSRNSEE